MALLTVRHTYPDGSTQERWIDVSLYNIQRSVSELKDGTKLEVIFDPVSDNTAMQMALSDKVRAKEYARPSERVDAISPIQKPDPGIKNARKFR